MEMECSSTQQKPWNPQKHGRFASNYFPLRSELFQVSAIRFFECRTTPNVIKVQVDLFIWNLPSCRLLFVVLLCLLVSSFVCSFVFWMVRSSSPRFNTPVVVQKNMPALGVIPDSKLPSFGFSVSDKCRMLQHNGLDSHETNRYIMKMQ